MSPGWSRTAATASCRTARSASTRRSPTRSGPAWSGPPSRPPRRGPGHAGRRRLRQRRGPPLGRAGGRGGLPARCCCCRPNAYRADEQAVVAHYARGRQGGLPVVAYNNPIDTKVDLTPGLLAELHGEGLIVAVKEFTGDVRRAYEIAELAPELDLLVGADDVCSSSPGRRGRLDRRLPQRASPQLRRAVPAPPSPATSTPPCRSTAHCTRCCAGTPRPSSSRPSSCPWTSPAAAVAPPARRAALSRGRSRPESGPPPRRPSPTVTADHGTPRMCTRYVFHDPFPEGFLL